jgi:hypothetical protein
MVWSFSEYSLFEFLCRLFKNCFFGSVSGNSLKNQPQMLLWADRFSNQCNLNKKKVNFAQMVFGKSTIPLSTTSFKKTKTFSIKKFILDKQSINY